MKKIKIAVIGIGKIGCRHVEVIQSNPNTSIEALIDVDQSVFNKFDQSIPFFNTLDSFFQSEISKAVEVISIASPNGFHYEHAKLALEYDRHVIIEKPMTLKEEHAIELMELADKRQKEIFVVMQNRYSPPSQWLKEIVESKKLGEIYLVELNCYWNRDERYYTKGHWHGNKEIDGGTLFTQFSHFVDILYWLFGEIENINARFFNFNHQAITDFEDSGIVHFDFKNKIKGTLNFSTSVFQENFESTLSIIAEKGTIKVGGQYMDRVDYCNIKDYQFKELPKTNAGNDYGAYKGSAQNHHYVYQNVVETLNGKSRPTTNGEDGRKIVKIINDIYNS